MKLSRMMLLAGALGASVAFASPAQDPPAYLLKWGSWGTGPGQFRYPYGVGTDSQGNVYVADKYNNRIQVFTGEGAFLRQWGAFGHDPGQMDNPTGLAVSSDDLVYLCDRQNGRIQVFTAAGLFVREWSVNGDGVAVNDLGDVYVTLSFGNMVRRYASDGTLITQWGSFGTAPGQLDFPIGIATDHGGSVYVADTGNNWGTIKARYR